MTTNTAPTATKAFGEDTFSTMNFIQDYTPSFQSRIFRDAMSFILSFLDLIGPAFWLKALAAAKLRGVGLSRSIVITGLVFDINTTPEPRGLSRGIFKIRH